MAVPAGAGVQAVGHHAVQLGQPGLIGEHHRALLEYVPEPAEEVETRGARYRSWYRQYHLVSPSISIACRAFGLVLPIIAITVVFT